MKRAQLNYAVDALIAIAFAVCAITGILFMLPPGAIRALGLGMPGMLGVSLRTWHWLHDWSGVAATVGVLLHSALHYRWIVAMTRRTFGAAETPARRADRGRPAAPVATLASSQPRAATGLAEVAARPPGKPRQHLPQRPLDRPGRFAQEPRPASHYQAALRRRRGRRSRRRHPGRWPLLSAGRRGGQRPAGVRRRARCGRYHDAEQFRLSHPEQRRPGTVERRRDGQRRQRNAVERRPFRYRGRRRRLGERNAVRFDCGRPGKRRHLGLRRVRALPQRVPGRRVCLGRRRQSRGGAQRRPLHPLSPLPADLPGERHHGERLTLSA
jgi:hypothetical protein